jgi:hypothetical protein
VLHIRQSMAIKLHQEQQLGTVLFLRPAIHRPALPQ